MLRRRPGSSIGCRRRHRVGRHRVVDAGASVAGIESLGPLSTSSVADVHAASTRPPTIPDRRDRPREARSVHDAPSAPPRTLSIRGDQSMSSVDSPRAFTAARSAASSSASAATSSDNNDCAPVAQRLGERRARAVGADRRGHTAGAGDRRQDEVAVDRLIGGVRPDARARAASAIDASVSWSPVAVMTRRTSSRSAASNGRSRTSAHCERSTASLTTGRHEPHSRPGRVHAGDLAGPDRAAPDDEHRHVVEVEEHRICEPRFGHRRAEPQVTRV